MIKIEVLKSEDLQSTVKKFISALLPTENFKPSLFGTILQTLFHYVKLEEFEMEYYLLLKALSDFGKIASSYEEFVPKLEKSVFESLVEKSVTEAVVNPELGVKEWREWSGMPSNLNNETVREECCQQLCQRASELYEECFEMAVSSDEVLGTEAELEAVFRQEIALQSINTQAAILRGSVRVGKKVYSGAQDALDYCALVCAEVKNRIDSASGDGTITLDSLEAAYTILGDAKASLDKIADWGIPPIDDGTPILRNRLVVVVGDEGAGKTHFIVDKVTNVVLAGKKALVMCGETKKGKVYYLILKNYIWKKFGIVVRNVDILNPGDCPAYVSKVINIAILETIESGALSFADAFSYDTVGAELQAIWDRVKFDFVAIDHSMALKGKAGDGSMHANVSALSSAVLQFKLRNPVCVVVASHTSVHSKEMLSKGKHPTNSTTKGSNNLSTDADEVFTLAPDPSLDKQGLIKFINSKRRDFERIVDPIILRKRFDVSAFVYDKDCLVSREEMTIDQQEALSALDNELDEEEFPY